MRSIEPLLRPHYLSRIHGIDSLKFKLLIEALTLIFSFLAWVLRRIFLRLTVFQYFRIPFPYESFVSSMATFCQWFKRRLVVEIVKTLKSLKTNRQTVIWTDKIRKLNRSFDLDKIRMQKNQTFFYKTFNILTLYLYIVLNLPLFPLFELFFTFMITIEEPE